MRDAFVPYETLNEPKPFAEDVWIVDGHEIRWRFFGLNVPFSTRMTVVRLPGGSLWVHSPVAGDEALFTKIAALGPVANLVAPNTLHWSYIEDWRRRFPDAVVYASPSLEAKVGEPRVIMNGDVEPTWFATLDRRLAMGPTFTETVFFHRPSRTLILTDLIENFEISRVRSRFWRRIMRFMGVVDPDGKAPVDMQWSFMRNRRQLRNVVQQMIDWEPRRIILSHGRCYENNAVAELKRAFRWIL